MEISRILELVFNAYVGVPATARGLRTLEDVWRLIRELVFLNLLGTEPATRDLPLGRRVFP
jgi:hypothetical protein